MTRVCQELCAASIPANPGEELHRTRTEIVAERQALADLATGAGRWEGTEVGTLARQVNVAERARQEAVWRSNALPASRGAIRTAKREIKQADARLDEILPRFERLAAPQRALITRVIGHLEQEHSSLETRASERRQWIAEHPETTRRLRHLDTELGVIDRALGVERDVRDGSVRGVSGGRGPVADGLHGAVPPTTHRPVQRAQEPELGRGL